MILITVGLASGGGCDAIDAGVRKAVQCDGVGRTINSYASKFPEIVSVADAEKTAVEMSNLERELTGLKLDDPELIRLVGEYTATLNKMSTNLRQGLASGELDAATASRHDAMVDDEQRLTRNLTAYCRP